MRWETLDVEDTGLVETLSQALNLSPCIASILVGRGLSDVEAVRAFLAPRLQQLDDPFALSNMDAAVARLCKAMLGKEHVVVVGDYDVDGVTSTSLFVSVVRRFGMDPQYIVPRRKQEGYGLTMAIIERVFELYGKPELLVVLDCGTNSINEVAYLREQGVEVVIIDHHKAKAGYAQDCVIVNPHVFDPEAAPWRNLCTVGLVFKWMHAFLKLLRLEGNEIAETVRLRDYLDLVALGTIADLVPLLAENRILASIGLQRMRQTDKPGLHALFQVSGLPADQPILPTDVAFRLSPRINASGRLADAALPVKMLLGEHYVSCLKLAEELDEMNSERQSIERGIFDEALAQVESTGQLDAPGIVVYGEDWHAGVVGIVAGKLVQHFNRPCIVLGREGEMARGSGRTVPELSLVETLKQCDELLGEWGGHPMAVGVSVPAGKLDALRVAFCEAIGQVTGGVVEEPHLLLEYWMKPSQLTEALMEELEAMGPYGMGHRQPVLGIRGLVLQENPAIFATRHFRFFVPMPGGRNMSGVAWKMADNMPPVGEAIDIAFKLKWNLWNGRRNLQMELVDWRPTV